jgi:hypothetical protein
LAFPAAGTGAEAPAVVTLLEGEAALLRTTGRLALAEGVRVQAGDIVEVPDKSLVQLEFADGAKLSLGPLSRFYVAALAGGTGSAAQRAKGTPVSDFYLLQGWTKLALPKSSAPTRLTTPLFGLSVAEAVAVVQVQAREGSLFVEQGEVRLAEGFVKASAASPVGVRAGQFYVRRADQRGSVEPRAGRAFIAGMPRPYQDNLPDRLARYRERNAQPRRLGDLAYADVEAWLKGPPALRRPLMQRLRSKAQEPEFRAALVANMRFHPEWDPIVFPEKYQPKPEPPAAGPNPTASRGR